MIAVHLQHRSTAADAAFPRHPGEAEPDFRQRQTRAVCDQAIVTAKRELETAAHAGAGDSRDDGLRRCLHGVNDVW